MPLSFFAPHHGYAARWASGACRQHHEFRAVVKALHRAGIEVILDVVCNHTAEGNQDGPVYSFEGIDNSTFYLMSDRPWDPYEDFSGTGNTLHCANRYVGTMIVEACATG
jgi:isoamylase